MKSIRASDFKARCLRIMDEVETRREQVVITKKGRPVAKLVPAETPSRKVFGCLEGRLEIVGDIVSPTTDPKDWDALK